jgi:hypothetical protein
MYHFQNRALFCDNLDCVFVCFNYVEIYFVVLLEN